MFFSSAFSLLLSILIFFASIYSTNHENQKNWKGKPYKYQLALCAIFKNEAPYLKEWIEFHKLVGVEHFYLYNNESDDNYLEVLKPYLETNQVDLIDWKSTPEASNELIKSDYLQIIDPIKKITLTSKQKKDFPNQELNKLWKKIQTSAYLHCINNIAGKVKWLIVIDTDEFLFSPQKTPLLKLLEEYHEFGGVCVNWQIFGTSHIEEIPHNKLLIETLTLKALPNYVKNRLVKSIVRPECVAGCVSPHVFILKKPFQQVDTNKKPVKKLLAPNILIDKIRINHYWTRDEKFFKKVKIGRRLEHGDALDIMLERYRISNSIEDKSILKFVKKLKKRVLHRSI